MHKKLDYSPGVSAYLRAMAKSGALSADEQQLKIAQKLEFHPGRIENRTACLEIKRAGLAVCRPAQPSNNVLGLYIHGKVGRGKTMLMDMFYELAPPGRKRRAHFHEFMADVHGRIHAHRQQAEGRGNQAGRSGSAGGRQPVRRGQRCSALTSFPSPTSPMR